MIARLSPLLFLLLLLSACNLDDDACGATREPIGPPTFSVTRNSPGSDGVRKFGRFQMFDAETGYTFEDSDMYQTTDGGVTWTVKTLDFTVANERFVFTSPTEGWVAGGRFDEAPFLMKTDDGGQSFTRFDYVNIQQGISDIAMADNGDLYLLTGSRIVRSTDGGGSFQVVHTAQTGNVGNLTVTSERVYLTVQDELVTLSREGALLATNAAPNDDFSVGQLHVNDTENLLYAGGNSLRQSTDGGITWTLLHDQPAFIAGGNLDDEGVLLLLSEGQCTHSSGQYEVTSLAVLTSAGLERGPTTVGIEVGGANDAQYLGNGRWFMAYFDQVFYEIVTM